MRAARQSFNVVRIFGFPVQRGFNLQTSPGVYNEAAFAALDRVVNEAGKAGLKLIIALTNNWNYNDVQTDWKCAPPPPLPLICSIACCSLTPCLLDEGFRSGVHAAVLKLHKLHAACAQLQAAQQACRMQLGGACTAECGLTAGALSFLLAAPGVPTRTGRTAARSSATTSSATARPSTCTRTTSRQCSRARTASTASPTAATPPSSVLRPLSHRLLLASSLAAAAERCHAVLAGWLLVCSHCKLGNFPNRPRKNVSSQLCGSHACYRLPLHSFHSVEKALLVEAGPHIQRHMELVSDADILGCMRRLGPNERAAQRQGQRRARDPVLDHRGGALRQVVCAAPAHHSRRGRLLPVLQLPGLLVRGSLPGFACLLKMTFHAPG